MQSSVIARYKNEVTVKTNQWSTGTFGCFDNIGVCIVAFLVPCVSFGQTAEALGENCCMHTGLWYWIPFVRQYFFSQQRAQLREIRGIPGSCLSEYDRELRKDNTYWKWIYANNLEYWARGSVKRLGQGQLVRPAIHLKLIQTNIARYIYFI